MYTIDEICHRYIADRAVLKDTFSMEQREMYAVCACQLCGHGKTVREDELVRAKKILKQGTGLFSSFRGTGEMSVIAALAAAEDPEGSFAQMQEMYALLKEEFSGSGYLAMLAVILPEIVRAPTAGDYIRRGKRLYQRMRREHPILTSAEDGPLAVLLAISPKDDDRLIDETERAYDFLKQNIRWTNANSVQTVSHILALSRDGADFAAERFMDLFRGLEAAGKKYGKNYQLAALAVLAISDRDTEELLRDMLSADAFLAGQKDYKGLFGVPERDRLMHAAMLVSLMDENSAVADSGVLTSTLSMIAARQAVLCAMIVSSSASSAAASAGH